MSDFPSKHRTDMKRNEEVSVRNGLVKSRPYEKAEVLERLQTTEIKGAGMRKAIQLVS